MTSACFLQNLKVNWDVSILLKYALIRIDNDAPVIRLQLTVVRSDVCRNYRQVIHGALRILWNSKQLQWHIHNRPSLGSFLSR
jgi:hypothetical protein